jgi:hypothetical protein
MLWIWSPRFRTRTFASQALTLGRLSLPTALASSRSQAFLASEARASRTFGHPKDRGGPRPAHRARQ